MKTIWTLLFLALIAATFGLTLMFVPESSRTDRFWISMGAIGFAEAMVWISVTFWGTRRGEQASGFAGATMLTSTVIYLFVTLALGTVALLVPIFSFKVLLALHIVALLAFAFIAGISAIGTRALQGTNEATKPRQV